MTRTSAIHERVQEQFGPVAERYTVSPGHADAKALQRVVDLAQPRAGDRALDVATGAGHTALAIAPHVAEVVAYDLTAAMLAETQRNASQRGIANIDTQQGAAEELPFADESFEIVTVRIAPHHFADVRRAVAEMARVVKPGGRVLVIDTAAPEDDALDEQINHIEKLRDPSHVRDYRVSEWRQMVEEAGLTVASAAVSMYREPDGRMSFRSWTARMRTPPDVVRVLEGLFREASPALREALDIRIEGEEIAFTLPLLTLVAEKPVAGSG